MIRTAEASNIDATARSPTSKSIDWYAEGQGRSVEVEGIRVLIKLIGRKGRRARIAIEAPAGAEFRAVDSTKIDF